MRKNTINFNMDYHERLDINNVIIVHQENMDSEHY